MNRKTKIVATIGPQRKQGEDNPTRELGEFNENGGIPHGQLLEKFIESGVDIIRLNMSFAYKEDPYGNDEGQYLGWLKDNKNGIAGKVAVLGDLPGPKIRLKDVNFQGRDIIAKGDNFFLGFGEALPPDGEIGAGVSVNNLPFDNVVYQINGKPTFSAYAKGLDKPALLSIGDGKVELQVVELLDRGIVRCKLTSDIVYESDIPSGKGLTIKHASLDFPAFGESDKRALDFLLKNGGGVLAYVAVSFAQSQHDIISVKHYIEEHEVINKLFEETKVDNPYISKKILAPGIIAKIETQKAIDNIDEILDIADGVMVARGDLGEQLPTEDVPRIQKELIRKCNTRGKVVITATQMLDSMEKKPAPTRAEAADVFNAILDGTDAVMLSGETSTGAHPVKAIETMATIAESAEQYYFSMKNRRRFEQVIVESSLLIDESTSRLKEEEEKAREQSKYSINDKPYFNWIAELIGAKIKSSKKQWTTDRICKAACELSEVQKDNQSNQLIVHRESTDRESKPILIPTTSG